MEHVFLSSKEIQDFFAFYVEDDIIVEIYNPIISFMKESFYLYKLSHTWVLSFYDHFRLNEICDDKLTNMTSLLFNRINILLP